MAPPILATDFGASREDSAFLHAEHLGFDIPVQFGVGFEFTPLGGDRSFNFTEELNLTCFNIASNNSVFADGYFAFVRDDFTFDFSINDHVIGKFDGTFDFDSVRKNISCIRHNGADFARLIRDGNQTIEKFAISHPCLKLFIQWDRAWWHFAARA